MSESDSPLGAQDPEATPLDAALQRLDRWSERVSFELFRFGLYVTMPALVVLVSLDVTLRYVFNAPLQWARDVNGILLLVTIFSALPHAWDRAYHIRMEVFYERFSAGKRRIADILSSVSGVIFFGLMAVQAARFVPFMMQTGETGEDLDFPLWPFMAVLSFCALVVVARIFSNPPGTERHLRYPSVAAAEKTSKSSPEEGGDPGEASDSDAPGWDRAGTHRTGGDDGDGEGPTAEGSSERGQKS